MQCASNILRNRMRTPYCPSQIILISTCGGGRDQRPCADHRRRGIYAGGRQPDPHGRDCRGCGHSARFHASAPDRRADRRSIPPDEAVRGYDHNFVLWGAGFRRAARVEDPQSGRVMEVYTDKPGMQLHTANFMPEMKGKNGVQYGPRTAYCFETQLFPDSVHHDEFPSCILQKERPTTT